MKLKIKLVNLALVLAMGGSIPGTGYATDISAENLALSKRIQIACGYNTEEEEIHADSVTASIGKLPEGRRDKIVEQVIRLCRPDQTISLYTVSDLIESFGTLEENEPAQVVDLTKRLEEVHKIASKDLSMAQAIANLPPDEWGKVENYSASIKKIQTVCGGRDVHWIIRSVHPLLDDRRDTIVDQVISLCRTDWTNNTYDVTGLIESFGKLEENQPAQVVDITKRLEEIHKKAYQNLSIARAIIRFSPNEWEKVEAYSTFFLNAKRDFLAAFLLGLGRVKSDEQETFLKIFNNPRRNPNLLHDDGEKGLGYFISLMVDSPAKERERFYQLYWDMDTDKNAPSYFLENFHLTNFVETLRSLGVNERLPMLELLYDLGNGLSSGGIRVLKGIPDPIERKTLVGLANQLYGRGLEELSKFPTDQERVEAVHLTLMVDAHFGFSGQDKHGTSTIQGTLNKLLGFPKDERRPVTSIIINRLGRFISSMGDLGEAFGKIFMLSYKYDEKESRSSAEVNTLLDLAEKYFNLKNTKIDFPHSCTSRIEIIAYLLKGIQQNMDSEGNERLKIISEMLKELVPEETKDYLSIMGGILHSLEYISTEKLRDFVQKLLVTYPKAKDKFDLASRVLISSMRSLDSYLSYKETNTFKNHFVQLFGDATDDDFRSQFGEFLKPIQDR